MVINANTTVNAPSAPSQSMGSIVSQDPSGQILSSSPGSFLDLLSGLQSMNSEGVLAKGEDKQKEKKDFSSWLALLQMLTQQGGGGALPAHLWDNANVGAAHPGEVSRRGNAAGVNVMSFLSPLFNQINTDSADGQTGQPLSESDLGKIKELLQRVLSHAPAMDNQEQQKLIPLLQRVSQWAEQGEITSVGHAANGSVLGQQTPGLGSWAAGHHVMANHLFEDSLSRFPTRPSPGDSSTSGPFGSWGSNQTIETVPPVLGHTGLSSDNSASSPSSQAMGSLPRQERNDSLVQGNPSSAFVLYPTYSSAGKGSTLSPQKGGQVEASRLAQQLPEQVIQRAQWLRQGETATFQLTLVPDGLGQIHVAVERNAQAHVSLLLSADTLQAQQLLDSQLPVLRQQLEQQGLQLRDLKVVTPEQMQMEMQLGMGGGFMQQHPRENLWYSPSADEPNGYPWGESSSPTVARERDSALFARWSMQEENGFRSDNQIDFRA